MTESEQTTDQPASGWRVKCGLAVFALSILLPVAGIPAVSFLDLTTTMTASVSGILLVGAEVLGLVAIAIMGKPGYLFIKGRIFGFLKGLGPAAEVSRARYNFGLVLFCLPLLFGWLSPYLVDVLPGLPADLVVYAVIGDVVIVVSLFVVGGDFWDKIRALFVHGSKIYASSSAAPDR